MCGCDGEETGVLVNKIVLCDLCRAGDFFSQSQLTCEQPALFKKFE